MRITELCKFTSEKPLPLPLFETGVRAGFPSPAEEEISTSLDLNSYLVPHPASTFFVRVVGDSMEGAGIFSGDLLIVDRSLEPAHGKIVLAVLSGEFTVKRLLFKEGRVVLAAENPSYPSISITGETEFSIWGVVTHAIHKT